MGAVVLATVLRTVLRLKCRGVERSGTLSRINPRISPCGDRNRYHWVLRPWGWAGGLLLIGGSLACTPAADLPVAAPEASTVKQAPDRNFSLPSLPFAQQTQSIDSLSQSQGQTVTVAGAVQRQVPLVAGQLYQIRDATGQVWIAAGANGADIAVGDRITVKGTVRYQEIQISGSNLSEYYIQSEQIQVEAAPTP